jgi:competence protein ComEC
VRSWSSGFAAGALLLALPWSWRPWIVSGACALLLLSLPMVLLAVTRRGRRPLPPAVVVAACLGAALGVIWSAAHHERALADRIAHGGSRDAVPVIVRIEGDPVALPAGEGAALALRFRAEVLEGGPGNTLAGKTLRLSWYTAQPVRHGETWRLATTLRPPWGYANPAGFDFERWLLGQGIDGLGTIRRGERIAVGAPGWVVRTRERLGSFVGAQELAFGPVLLAQLTGATGGIPQAQWEVFRVTGTIHLMVISGLHIALAAGFGFWIGRGAARLLPAVLRRVDARKLGAGSGIACAAVYLALSGGGLPAVRACLMAAPALLLAAWGRRCQPESGVVVALAAILALDPLAVHQQGFWLSFGAVAILVLGYARRRGRRAWWVDLIGTQWLLTAAMAPILVVLIGAVPVSGIAANLLAVPVVSFGVVPLVLLAGLLADAWPAAAATSLWFADLIFRPLYAFLVWCAKVQQVYAEPGPGAALAASGAALAWLLGVSARRQIPLLLCLAGALMPRVADVQPGEFRVIALDVGQGDAILVDTARRRLLFDAGPAFPGGFETGSAVVVPNVVATGPARIDALVLSHADLDHVGGAAAVVSALRPVVTFASFARPETVACSTARWRWDGVEFRFVDVPRTGPGGRSPASNDGSCVLVVDNGRRRALLAGDVGAGIEARLIRPLADGVDLLFAPHHGSISSSSMAFVRVLGPRHVFVSAGLDNRYGHPHPRVVERYGKVGVELLRTDRQGALVWHSREPDKAFGWRVTEPPYWRGSTPAASAGGPAPGRASVDPNAAAGTSAVAAAGS